ncbi:GNAT family N-acetyltransferase [Nakamurella sp. A5-74]|uniref:GNAT family N-acetyltransferase n=1 Tax=Nakamurella sp. A5-74 TaxID=3158264 RepID=A0AAU8DSL0_9ACTN
MNAAGPLPALRPPTPSGASSVQVTAARARADAAGAAAGVRVTSGEDRALLAAALGLVQQIWQADAADAPVTMAVLRAVTHAGGYCAIARDVRGTPAAAGAVIGACIGFLGSRPRSSLHSHIAGVLDAGLGRGVGYALKLDQRAWAAEQGLESITWTFDPLVRRNAFFNLAKLGVRVSEYLPDFYGAMEDSVNAGQGSDRLLVQWPVIAPEHGPTARAVTAEPDAVLLDHLPGRPDEPGPIGDLGHFPAWVRIPADIERLRRERPELAIRWRHAVRSTLGVLLAGPTPLAWVDGMSRDGWYRLSRVRDDG